MKKISSFLIALLLFWGIEAFAQKANLVSQWLNTAQRGKSIEKATLFKSASLALRTKVGGLSKQTFLELETTQLRQLVSKTPATLSLSIPNDFGTPYELELARVEIVAPGFNVKTSSGEDAPDNPGIHYRGIVKGDQSSVVSISVFEDEVMGLISAKGSKMVLGKIKDNSGRYSLFDDKDLEDAPDFECMTDDTRSFGPANRQTNNTPITAATTCAKTVRIYFEADNRLYQNNGSNTTNTTNYITGLFNQVATLYANEGINVAISEIFIWTTTDPYNSLTSTSSVLSSFRTNKNTSGFNGELAHFLSGRSLGGGIAYLDVLCGARSYAYGVSANLAAYNTVPTYSWSVMVVTHELGHNFGSPHTQSCTWSGGALDNCYTTEGGCPRGPAPTNGGTIMSYCHTVSGVGINFANGFGQQPGDLIRQRYNTATCIAGGGPAPTGLATSGITNTAANIAWNAVNGATTYTYEYKATSASTWIVVNTSNTSASLTGLQAGTSYAWRVKTDCSSYTTANFSTTGSNPACVPPVNLSANVTGTRTVTLSWGAVAGATGYTVQYRVSTATAWTTVNTSSTSLNLSSLSVFTTYNWQVRTNCSNYSAVASFTTAASSCSAPTGLAVSNITNNSARVSWGAVAGALNYTVQFRRSSVSNWTTFGTVTGTSATLTGLLSNTAYRWRVKAACSSYTTVVASFTTLSSARIAKEEVTETASFDLYPNPTRDVLNIRLNDETQIGVAKAQVLDPVGRVLVSIVMDEMNKQVNVTGWNSGLYLVSVTDDKGKSATKKFVKE